MRYDSLISQLKKDGVQDEFLHKQLAEINPFLETSTHLEVLISAGLPIIQKDDKYFLATKFQSYKNETYCIVDIEANGSKPTLNQIIEIGAIKYKNGQIIDKFHSLVKAEVVPEYITKITGITAKDLVDAPSNEEILLKFKTFLADSIFVAHNAKFDFQFISTWMEEIGVGKLRNRSLCSIDLAKKTIEADRFGLEFLKELLNIETTLHRAYEDALATTKVFEVSLKNIPIEIESTEELIEFSKFIEKKKTKKREPKN